MKKPIGALLLAGTGLWISGCSNEPPKAAPVNQPAAGNQPAGDQAQPKDHEPAKTDK
jgi:hypothetical protein